MTDKPINSGRRTVDAVSAARLADAVELAAHLHREMEDVRWRFFFRGDLVVTATEARTIAVRLGSVLEALEHALIMAQGERDAKADRPVDRAIPQSG